MIARKETSSFENFMFTGSPILKFLVSPKEFVKTMEIVKKRSLIRK